MSVRNKLEAKRARKLEREATASRQYGVRTILWTWSIIRKRYLHD